MRLLTTYILCAIITAFPLVAHADKLVTTLRVSVDTFAIRRIDADTPTRVVFTGAPMKAEVALVAALLPNPKMGPASLRLPAAEWWEQLTWNLDREGGDTPRLRPVVISIGQGKSSPIRTDTADVPVIKAGERLVAHFNLGELPKGTYRLAIQLGDLRSEPEWFLVSNGGENADLRREFARYNVDKSRDRASLKKNLLELAAADPLNASPWIRLGDLALVDGSVEEIRGYYDRAARVLERRRQKFASEGREEVADAIQRDREMILAVSDILPHFVANRATLVLHADVGGGRRYILRDRMTNRVLRTIAPRSVEERR